MTATKKEIIDSSINAPPFRCRIGYDNTKSIAHLVEGSKRIRTLSLFVVPYKVSQKPCRRKKKKHRKQKLRAKKNGRFYDCHKNPFPA